jgi:hypothetical protein
MVHKLGDPGSTMGHHQVCTTKVTSHDDGVVDRCENAPAWMKHGAMAARGASGEARVAPGVGGDTRAMLGTTTLSEVPTTEKE